MGEPAQNLPQQGTPPSGSKRGRKMVALEDVAESPVAVSASANGCRNIRRRTNSRSPTQDALSAPFPEMSHAYDFLVYLPNATFVEVRVDGAICNSLTVQGFVELVRIFEKSKNSDTKAKKKQVVRKIQWNSDVYIQDFEGNPVNNGEFIALGDEIKAGRGLLLYDNHSDTVHAHPNFWNVTPEPEMLTALPQDYTVFSALADELDNSLQAVYQLQPGKKRLICVDLDHADGKIIIYDTGKGMDSTSQNSISKWGTIGASMNRHSVTEAIGGQPPYLKPNFGMYGFGGIGAGFHLGGRISVSSKTETSERVAILHLGKDTLKTSVKPGRVWKTGGEFRSPTAKELEWSPHGSFTKVEITDLNREIPTWKVADVQRKLKDFYFPYIQNDEGFGGTTFRPVEIRVNGLDLAEVLGGEVAHSNFYSGIGEPYVLILEFTKEMTTAGGIMVEKANARITCRYYPIKQGREAIDDIIQELTDEDPELVGVNFDTFSRRSIRRLGRLLPDARGEKPLPFMEPKRTLKANEVNRHWYKRAKAFIDVDAGFKPTLSKMDLVSRNSFNEALLNLGRVPQNVEIARTTARMTFKEPGLVTVSIKHDGAVIKADQLHAHYTKWITLQHEKYDTGAEFNESRVVIVSQPHHKKELNISDDVFRVVYDIKCRDIRWEIGEGKGAVRLKLLKGIPGLNNNDMILYVTVECFISEGFSETPGEARIICRPMGIPEERGSKEILGDDDREPDFILGESRVFPIEDILFTKKYERVEEEVWLKQVEKMRSKSPAFVELLNEQEVSKLGGHESLPKYANIKAGAGLPADIIAVVRPRMCKPRDKLRDSTLDAPRLEQKFIIAEAMEMTLVVRKMKYHPQEVKFAKRDMSEAEKVYETKISASTRSNLKGLYCFSTKCTLLESITQTTGTYFFFFTLVSAKHQDVDYFMVRMNVTPSSKIGRWNICSHPGNGSDHQNRSPEVMKVRLGGVSPRNLYLSRVDEFSNPMGFEEIPSDIACGIYTVEGNQVTIPTTILKNLLVITNDLLNLEIPIKVGEGNLEPLKPTMQAVLKMTIAGVLVASFPISVLPGEVSSARIYKNEAPDNHLHPGQIIEQMVFEVLDSCQNPVSSGQKVKVVLEGFVLQDKNGHIRSVDGNGCVDLGMRLRVTVGYGEAARVELLSTEDLSLLEKTFTIIDRSLRTKNDPDHIAVGSQLEGIEIEAVDENGEVDHTMDGTTHSLTLDWNPNISVPMHQGRCTLPPIIMPSHAGLWEGCVAHTHYPNLLTQIKVWVEKVERQDNDLMAAEDPYDFSKSLLALPDKSESDQASVLRAVPLSGSDRQNLPDFLQSIKQEFQFQERKLVRLGQKMKQHDDELDRLQRMQREYEESKRRYQDELDSLKVIALETSTIISKEVDLDAPYNQITEENQVALYDPTMEEDQVVESYNADTEKNPGILGCTAGQVEMQIAKLGYPPGTNAATILLQAQSEQHCEISEDIIGIVALLGAVESEDLNRALVEFLGLENMLAIICRSRSAAECIGIPSIDGILDKNKGLSGFAKSRNLEISGRFRVITLTDESRFFKRVDGQPAVDNTHPQKLLNMGPISKSGSERPEGSLGYAVNMIQLSEEQLNIRVSGGHGLRESLFFVLLGFLEVFNTRDNMLKTWKDIRSSAVSLDGGLIRTSNQFELGSREDPVVWFPTWYPPVSFEQPSSTIMHERSLVVGPPQPLQSITPIKIARPVQHLKRKEVMKKMKDAHQVYTAKGVEGKIQKVTEQIQRTREKIEKAKQHLKDSFEKFHSVPETERISKLNLQAQNLRLKFGRRVC